MKKYTVQDCLNKAKSTIKQIEIEMDGRPNYATDIPLCFAAARVWLERAEFAYNKADNTVSESDFVDVAETLYNLAHRAPEPVQIIRDGVGRLP